MNSKKRAEMEHAHAATKRESAQAMQDYVKAAGERNAHEATIVRLRAELEHANASRDKLAADLKAVWPERDRLRAELEKAAGVMALARADGRSERDGELNAQQAEINRRSATRIAELENINATVQKLMLLHAGAMFGASLIAAVIGNWFGLMALPLGVWLTYLFWHPGPKVVDRRAEERGRKDKP